MTTLEKAPETAILTEMKCGPSVDFQPIYGGVAGLHHVAFAISDVAIGQARRLQAEAYRSGGLITEAAIGEDGCLMESLDPRSIRERSVYFVALEDGQPQATVRVVCPGQDVSEAPVFNRLQASAPGAYEELRSITGNDDNKIVEISALAKLKGASPICVVQSVLAMLPWGIKQGYEYAILDLNEYAAKSVMALFGPDNFSTLRSACATHSLVQDGVNQEMRLSPYIVRINEFLPGVCRYAKESLNDNTLSSDRRRFYEVIQGIAFNAMSVSTYD